MDIVLVRHGQPEWVHDGFTVVDPTLTALGHRQAVRVAEALGGEIFDEVLVSPLLRARQTAAPLLAVLGKPWQIEPWLHEIREPDWHGTPAEMMRKAYEEQRNQASATRWQGLPGGEPPTEFVERVRTGASGLLSARGMHRAETELPLWEVKQPEMRIAVVAHAGTNGVLLCQLLGLQPVPWEWDRFVTAHASITRLTSLHMDDGHTFSLMKLSDTEHLAPAERTM
jgi:2,3-bisphosphoglycerate-dependent phosphoglycerate mutase